jgi:CDP-paratose 2-epimerase
MKIGLQEWFRPGEHERVERVLADLATLGVSELRTGISWAEWHSGKGQEWYRWLLPRLARDVQVLPYFVGTPPELGERPWRSSPPRDPKLYADFLDVFITELGAHFEWVELWNEPNNLSTWDFRLDPQWRKFSQMVGGAAYWCRQRGKKTVLAGTNPTDPNWLRVMADGGVLAYIDAVGVHAFPGTFEMQWEDWRGHVESVRQVTSERAPHAEVWITETGYSTWRFDERNQLGAFLRALDSGVERLYWCSVDDLPQQGSAESYRADERHYHLGLRRADGTAKLLMRLWQNGGVEEVRTSRWMTEQRPRARRKHVLVTGGAGFIGTNLADRLLSAGTPVTVLDNLSRPGVEQNLKWLRAKHDGLLRVEIADTRDSTALSAAVRDASAVFQLAAQVAVTTSLVTPIDDFRVNAEGTVKLLEAIRAQPEPPMLLFTSTNKVYGALPGVTLRESGGRYEPTATALRREGVAETQPLDFHSPYGCSKGAADQYVIDYARSYGLPAVVFRMSCIYGTHQHGTEDQGWVAHFLRQAMAGKPIRIYGDGKQVRDVLFVDDLVDAMLLARSRIGELAGQAFNIGGGPDRTVSLLELLDHMEALLGRRPEVESGDWRTGDQRWYVSDIRRFGSATGWRPQVGVQDGVRRLYEWLRTAAGAASKARVA